MIKFAQTNKSVPPLIAYIGGGTWGQVLGDNLLGENKDFAFISDYSDDDHILLINYMIQFWKIYLSEHLKLKREVVELSV